MRNRKGNILLIVLITLVVLLGLSASVAGYFYWQKQNIPKQETSVGKIDNGTSDWQKYSDQVFKYSFEYPSSWLLSLGKGPYESWDSVVNLFSSKDTKSFPDVVGQIWIFKPVITYGVNAKKITAQEIVKNSTKGTVKNIVVDGHNVYRYDSVDNTFTSVSIIFDKESRAFNISFVVKNNERKDSNLQIVEKIISSIKL